MNWFPTDTSLTMALMTNESLLLWIKKFIAGFGGNSINITLVGESAGGGTKSASAQMSSLTVTDWDGLTSVCNSPSAIKNSVILEIGQSWWNKFADATFARTSF
jgi:Carboxylesterase type B